MKINSYNKTIFTVDFEAIKEAELHLELSKLKIIGRLFYIYKTIASNFGIKRIAWDLDDYEIENFDVEDIKDCIDDVYCCHNNPLDNLELDNDKYIALIDFKGSKREINFYDGSFPSRWVFENFEDELKNGIKEYKGKMRRELEEIKSKQQKLAEAKKNRAKIIANIKDKLTSEEIEVVFGSVPALDRWPVSLRVL